MLRGLVLSVMLLSSARIAHADDSLAQARKAIAESDYAAAKVKLAAARDAGGASPEDTAELYRLSGVVSAAMGDAKAATEAFQYLLALSPKATLPAGTSPKITRPFEAAGRYFTSHGRLELKLETAATPAITLVLVSDPLHMVARARVVFSVDGGAEQTREAAASDRTTIALPAGRRIDARVAALDASGNRLVELGSKEVPVVILGNGAPIAAAPRATPAAPRPEVVASSSSSLPLYRRWWPYAIGAAVFGGAGGYFAWQAKSDADDANDLLAADAPRAAFNDAVDRGKRNTLFANIGVGVAGALAITSGVMFWLAPREHREAQLSAVPVAGGGTLVFGGRF